MAIPMAKAGPLLWDAKMLWQSPWQPWYTARVNKADRRETEKMVKKKKEENKKKKKEKETASSNEDWGRMEQWGGKASWKRQGGELPSGNLGTTFSKVTQGIH